MKKTMTEWIRLARQGDEDAISYLYEQTYNSVYQSVLAIVRDEDEAMDIVQDSYIKGFQNLHKLDDPEKYQAWMKRLASNMAMDYLRKKRPALFSERVDEEGREIDLRHEDDCLEHMPEEVIDRQETARLMNEILGKLSQEQRLAVVLFYYEERSVREIAEMLDCSENTVKSRLNYGRKKIEAEVLALEKRGTKLYSLAPLPFFLWVVRMAKGYGIALETAASTAAVGAAGAAAAAGETAAAGGTAAGGTAVAATAGSSSAGTAAAGAAVKTAGTAAGKTLATKIVAGTLAATMTVGAGVTAVHNRNIEKENAAAHVVYEELLDRCRILSDMTHEERYREETLFWDELLESTLKKYPYDENSANITRPYIEENAIRCYDHPSSQDWDYVRQFDFKWETDLEQGIPMPDTVYFPTARINPIFDEEIYWSDEEWEGPVHYTAYYTVEDIDKNGIDDLLIWYKSDYPTGDSHKDGWIRFFTVSKGNVHTGRIHVNQREDGRNDWSIGIHGEGYWWDIDGITYRLVIFSEKSKAMKREKIFQEPDLEWKRLRDDTVSDTDADPGQISQDELSEQSAMREEEKLQLIRKLEGTYRIYSGIQFGNSEQGRFRPYHEVSLSVKEKDMVITDLGESEEVAQWRKTYTENLFAYHERVNATNPPSEEELDRLTIANLGTMKIPIHTIRVTNENSEICLQFDSVSFSGGEQSIPPFDILVTSEENPGEFFHLLNSDWDIHMEQHVVTRNGQFFGGSGFYFERQANESNDNT